MQEIRLSLLLPWVCWALPSWLADGAPTAPPKAVLPEVAVTVEAGGWVVSGAVMGGLTLP